MQDYRFAATLDDTLTPIMICNEKGTVIYKNEAARERLRLPRRRTSVMPHIAPEHQKRFDEITRKRRPAVVSVFTGDRYIRAFVTRLSREGREDTLWVFLSALRVMPGSRQMSHFESKLLEVSGDVCAIFKHTDESARQTNDNKREKLDAKKRERADRAIKKFYELDAPAPKFYDSEGGGRERNSEFSYAAQTLSAIARSAALGFKPFRPEINFKMDAVDKEHDLIVNSRLFIPLIINLFFFCASASRDRNFEVEADIEKDAELKLCFSALCPELMGRENGNPEELAGIFPLGALELKACSELCKKAGYSFSYSVTASTVNNVMLTVDADRIVLDENSPNMRLDEGPMEQLLFEQDLTRIFACFAEDLPTK